VTLADGDFTVNEDIVECGDRIEAFDPVFEMDLVKFQNKIIYIQEITASSPTTIKGDVNFMVCDDTQCLPPDYYDFSLDLASANEVDDFSIEKACEGDSFGSIELEDDGDGFIDPVEWAIDLEDNGDGIYKLILSAEIIDGWDI